ncbi:hypothetical protein RIR_jg15902.t1 [Rhizophagus irregularis DAOM 181602=DAOM 197198]|nr:hypothetical protein RIR_jg15902.t1 [Rhizophagus irregularis DAOM 181602=DAOM 197198]
MTTLLLFTQKVVVASYQENSTFIESAIHFPKNVLSPVYADSALEMMDFFDNAEENRQISLYDVYYFWELFSIKRKIIINIVQH